MKNLFKARWRQFKNTIKAYKKRQYFLFIFLTVGILGMMGFFFMRVFGYLYHQQEFPFIFKLFICEKILTMNFLTMFLMLILSALISTLNIFFLSRDLPLLLSSPLRARTVFAWKAVEVGVSSSLMVIFFSMPALIAYSYYFAPGPGDILGIILIFLFYIVSSVLIGIIIGLIIPAFISVKKLQPILSLVSIILISSIVIFLRLLRPEQFGNPEVINNLMNYMSGLKMEFLDYFPFSWIAKALHALALGEFRGYWLPVGAFLVVIFLLAAFTWFLQDRYYLKLYDKLNKGSGSVYRSSWKESFFLKRENGALWKKEVKTFVRTPAQWTQLLIIGAIMIVFVLNIRGIPMPHPSVKNIIAYLNLGMAAFVVSGLNSRFAFPTIPMESPGIVHLLSSPFKRSRLLSFKLLFFGVPQVVIGFLLFLAGDISLHLDFFARLSGVVYLLPVLPFLTFLSLFFSLRIEETVPLTPQHLLVSKNGIAYMLWSSVYIVLCMVYFLRPLFLYYYHRTIERPVPVFEILVWFGGFVVVNIGLMVLLYRKSLTLLRKKEFSASSA
jgi:ABC-2 type transport system permease protein